MMDIVLYIFAAIFFCLGFWMGWTFGWSKGFKCAMREQIDSILPEGK